MYWYWHWHVLYIVLSYLIFDIERARQQCMVSALLQDSRGYNWGRSPFRWKVSCRSSSHTHIRCNWRWRQAHGILWQIFCLLDDMGQGNRIQRERQKRQYTMLVQGLRPNQGVCEGRIRRRRPNISFAALSCLDDDIPCLHHGYHYCHLSVAMVAWFHRIDQSLTEKWCWRSDNSRCCCQA